MMRTVYKYQIPVEDVVQIHIPQGAKFVHLEAESVQSLLAWFEVDTACSPVVHTFHVHGTGHPIFPNSKYLGTVKVDPFVWHLYSSGGIS